MAVADNACFLSLKLVDDDVVTCRPVSLTEDADTIGFILGGNVLAIPQRDTVMVRGTVGSPEEDGAGRGVGHVIVVGTQVGLLVSRPGTQAKGVLHQSGAVKATEGAAPVNVRDTAIGNGESLGDGTVRAGGWRAGRGRSCRVRRGRLTGRVGVLVAGILGSGRASRTGCGRCRWCLRADLRSLGGVGAVSRGHMCRSSRGAGKEKGSGTQGRH